MKKVIALLSAIFASTLISSPAVASGQTAAPVKIVSAIDSGSGYSALKSGDSGDTVQFYDYATGIIVEVNNQALSADDFDKLRNYYNDNSLSDGELFKRYFDLKCSYINALQTLYNTNYMNPDKNSSETAMQVYYEGRETLYGLDGCNVYVYNIVRYEGLSDAEFVHLDMVVPDGSRNRIITIKFTIPKDKLSSAVSGKIRSMLSVLTFDGLPVQTEAPLALSSKSVIEKAQLGIYPAATQKYPEYKYFEDPVGGFMAFLPTTYVPFIRNSLGGVFTYTSFKINPNIIFSISSEPLQGSGMSDALIRFKVTSFGSVNMRENGTKTFGGKEYSFLSYDSTTGNTKIYYQDYYIKSGTRLFKLQLQSALAEPGQIVMGQMAKILAGFEPGTVRSDSQSAATSVQAQSYVKYMNSEEGYSFKYPADWRIQDISSDIAYDRLRLIIPGLSGALDITVKESELSHAVTFTDIVKSVTGKAVTSWPNLNPGYDPPFKGKTSMLLYSDFSINGPISIIYRLSVFVDDNGRNRLCYSEDIIKNRKVYSLFITAGEFSCSNGRFFNEQVNAMIDTVAGSFRLETTPESEARRIDGETRNRKLVFVERYLKQIIDPKLAITSVDKLLPDRTFWVTVGNTGESGFYRIRLDYAGRNVEILDSVLKRTILENELAKLKELYKGKQILKAMRNESNMTLTIETRENPTTQSVTRTYGVNARIDGGQIKWDTVRLAHQEDYMWECENYVRVLLSDARVYFQSDNVFTDMEPFRKKGMDYRFVVYVTSSRISGFLTLKMDPRSSLISTEGGLVPLDYVVSVIRDKYGIKYLSSKPGAVSFNPDTFVLSLRDADKDGNDTMTEYYKIQYNLDYGTLEYKSLN